MTVTSDVYQGRPDLRRSLELRGSQLSRRERGYFKSAGGYARMQQDNQTMQQVIDRGRRNQERLSSKQVNTANWTDEKGRKVYAGNPPMRFNVKNSFEPEGDQIDEAIPLAIPAAAAAAGGAAYLINKARQAAITNEILEIVGGAEALNN